MSRGTILGSVMPGVTVLRRCPRSATFVLSPRRKIHAALPDPVQLHPATWAKLIQNPEDRRAAATQYIEAVGGKLHGFWYAFGDHDAYNLWEAPDNVSMAATAIAISGGGALSSLQTTVLLTVEETLAALHKASSITYRPPGAEG